MSQKIFVVSYSYLHKGKPENEIFLFSNEDDAVRESTRIREITERFSPQRWEDTKGALCRSESYPTCPLLYSWTFDDVALLRVIAEDVK